MAVKLSNERAQAVLDTWRGQIVTLLDQVEAWARSQGWDVERRGSAEIREEGLPGYTTQVLDIQVGDEARVCLEPVARHTLNRLGVVELRAWPTLRRVRLQPTDADGSGSPWVVMTDSGIPLHQDWNPENFVTLVDDLVAQ